jgi:hypothetical protein
MLHLIGEVLRNVSGRTRGILGNLQESARTTVTNYPGAFTCGLLLHRRLLSTKIQRQILSKMKPNLTTISLCRVVVEPSGASERILPITNRIKHNNRRNCHSIPHSDDTGTLNRQETLKRTFGDFSRALYFVIETFCLVSPILPMALTKVPCLPLKTPQMHGTFGTGVLRLQSTAAQEIRFGAIWWCWMIICRATVAPHTMHM